MSEAAEPSGEHEPGSGAAGAADRPSGRERPMGRERPEVTIVIPVQSHKAEVREVIAALGGELDRLGRSWEALLVYDGIKGPLWQVGLDLQASTDQQVRTIALHKPFGESVCLSSAFEHSRGEVILTAPQYVQVDPRELARLFGRLDEGSDVVASWRHPRIDAGLNRLQSAAFNWVLRLVVGGRFHDLNCPLRLIRREVLEQVTIYGNMYRYLPAIAHHQGFRVSEVPVRHLRELGGTGIFGPGVYARRFLDILAVMFLTKFTHKPLRFFGALGGISMSTGGIIATLEIVRWWSAQGTGLYQRPFFLLGVLFFVLGVQIVGFGLVGEIIIFTQAKNVREYRIERIHE